MNAVTKSDHKPMLLDMMAEKAGLRPQEFADTVRATCGLAKASNEEFAAFLMVAREYSLNPLLKEIYAFPAKGGGIVPIVSIDGWISMVNSHAQSDGFEFDVAHDEKGELVSITCRMYRKDRTRPVEVTEYYEECKRGTDPWKMKHRMLRHKAMIQAARYAFGFSGIYDEDEGAKIAEMRDITPAAAPLPPKPPVPPSEAIGSASDDARASRDQRMDDTIIDGEIIDQDTGEVVDEREIVPESCEQTAALMDSEIDDTAFFDQLEADLAVASDEASIEEVWSEADPMARFEGKPNGETNQGIAMAIKKKHLKRVSSNG